MKNITLMNQKLNIDQKILSEFDSIITLQSFSLLNDYNSKLKISGNFYKWLNGHNVTGCENLIDLVLQTIEKLKNLNLVDPTKEQLETIRLGNFRLYRVDVKETWFLIVSKMLFNICLLLEIYRLIQSRKNNI